MSTGTPDADLHIDETLVRKLLRAQHPDFADMPIVALDAGWDNAMFRLGSHFVIRLPRRALAAKLAKHEQTWLPGLADRLPLSIPAPVAVGQPGSNYPWCWSIVSWLPGTTANLTLPAADEARPLAEFLRALHRPAPGNAPQNDLRGVPLSQRAAQVEDRLNRLQSIPGVVTTELLEVWQQALSAPEAEVSHWIHGDLHARNVLVKNGKITGIIDWGDITSGDTATDLASVWMLFSQRAARKVCLKHYQADAAVIARAKGWAVFFGATLFETGITDDPHHAAMGEVTLKRLQEDAA